MTITLRRAQRTDAGSIASLLTELGYPSTAVDVTYRLHRSLHSRTSCCLIAEAANKAVGLMSAELVPYFPTGTTICRVTSLVVSAEHRRSGVGEQLVAAAAEFAREHHCSGIEVTSAERRADAHRFYERLGFSRTAFRFFRAL
jgi:N-acetylglutamate synthase-like GNAT family acetyltransferase